MEKSALKSAPLNGGINNQRYGLIGLSSRCIEEEKNLVLPLIVDFRPGVFDFKTIDFASLYDPAVFSLFLRRYGVSLVANAVEEEAWPFVPRGSAVVARIRNKDVDATRLLIGFSEANYTSGVDKYIKLIKDANLDCVVQLRVENDWKHYLDTRIKGNVSTINESFSLDPLHILRLIKSRMNHLQSAYICIDRGNIDFDLETIRDKARRDMGLKLHFNFDFIGDASVLTSNAAVSSVDFEIAAAANCFIGHSRSTFSGMSELMYVLRGNQNRDSFVYNGPNETLIQRTDAGVAVDPLETSTLFLRDWVGQVVSDLKKERKI